MVTMLLIIVIRQLDDYFVVCDNFEHIFDNKVSSNVIQLSYLQLNCIKLLSLLFYCISNYSSFCIGAK